MSREDFLIGMVIGAAAASDANAPGTAADVQHLAAVALGDALLEELLAGGVDLHRLARRWVTWAGEAPRVIAPSLREALDHLRDFDAPAPHLAGPVVAALAAALPAAVASASPRSMITGAFHVSRLLDPRESTALCSTALVVAAATFLDGRRDFIPELIAVLRSNQAPPELLDAILMIPRDRRIVPPVPVGDAPDPIAVASWILWQAYHRPHGVDALEDLVVGGVDPAVGAVAAGLLGARDGIAGWPAAWHRAAAGYAGPRRRLLSRLDTAG
ncbi:MAG: ADP-ribosylglycohydrolase family protein [Gemmatimonadales bacterium]